MAAAESPGSREAHPRVPHIQPHIHKSNVSQVEYSYKHRIFFEDVRRAELRRRRRSGQSINSLQFRKIHSFDYIDEQIIDSNQGEVTKSFTFNVDIPQKRNSINFIDSAELRLQIIPISCQSDTHITLTLLNVVKQVHVDSCKPRWESLSIYPVPSSLDNITVTCSDCHSQHATFTSPHLNIVTLNRRRTRYPRRVSKKQDRRKCRLSPQVVDFRDLPSFKFVEAPRTADIGRCRGVCNDNFKPQSQNTYFKYELHRLRKGPLPCCAPSKFQDLEYLKSNGVKMERYRWPDAIAIECSCH